MEDEHPDRLLIEAREAIDDAAAVLAGRPADPRSAAEIAHAWVLVERVRQREARRQSKRRLSAA